METFDCAPILLIGFNRPDRLLAQVERLRSVKPRKLFIAVDGPREGVDGEDALVGKTRSAAAHVDWPCELHTRFLDANHGCRLAPPEAISWMFDHVDSGIILEDDCVPDVAFFRYASEMLLRYKDAASVAMVSGNNAYGFHSNRRDSYHFSRHVNIWGWATWKRAWDLYDVTMKRYEKFVDEILRDRHLGKYDRYWRKYLTNLIARQDTWDIQWCVTVKANNLLCVVPRTNLVANIGHVSGATHTSGYTYDAHSFLNKGTVQFPLVHPEAILADEKADRLHGNRHAGYFPRGLTFVGAKLPFLRPAIDNVGHALERIAPLLFRI